MKKNRKIDVKALIKAIVMKWPFLAAGLLVFGLVGCGKYYVSNRNVSPVETKRDDVSDKNYNDSQKDAIHREIEWLNQFIDETPANKIDSYKAGYASTTLYVSGGDGEIQGKDTDNLTVESTDTIIGNVITETAVDSDPKVNMVMESLTSFLASGVDWSNEKETYQVSEDAYLYDLLNVKVSGNALTISFWYDTPENAEKILDDVTQQTVNTFQMIKETESLDGYDIKETVSGSATKVMTGSDNWVTQRITQLKNLASSIENSNAVSNTAGSSSNSGTPSFSSKAMIKEGIKYGIAGIVLIAFILMIYILKKGYVLSEEEFHENSDIKTIASISSKYQGIDVENLKETLKITSGKTIIVTDVKNMNVLNQLKDTYEVSDSLLTDVKEREQLNKYDNAVICIQNTVSTYQDTDEIIRILSSRNIKIIGTVFVK